MLTVMFGFGLLISVGVDRDARLNRAGVVPWPNYMRG